MSTNNWKRSDSFFNEHSNSPKNDDDDAGYPYHHHLLSANGESDNKFDLSSTSSTALALRNANERVNSKKQETSLDDPSTAHQQPRRRKKTRWAQLADGGIPTGGTSYNPSYLPTMLSSSLTEEQKEMCALSIRIEDASKRLRTGDLGIPPNPEDRSPSPEPIYSHEGKRLNTREYRVKKRLEQDRHKCIQRMMILNPAYRPPHDYKPMQVKFNDRVWIPQDENPEVNFVGLIIGPRGNTLKALETETDTKIIIRGKGSVKEGKITRPLPAEDEPLHAYITATSQEAVERGVKKIQSILAQAIELPEHQNELRKQQLKQLALLNGTLRDDGSGIMGGSLMRCTNCGSTEHRPWNCPEAQNITHKIRCGRCGGVGHLERDCKVDLTTLPAGEAAANAALGVSDPNSSLVTASTSAIDDLLAPAPTGASDPEYMSLMAELGSKHPSAHPAGSSSVAPTTAATPTTSVASLTTTPAAPSSFAVNKFNSNFTHNTAYTSMRIHNNSRFSLQQQQQVNEPTYEYPPDRPPPASSLPRMVVYPHTPGGAVASKPMPSAQASAVISAHTTPTAPRAPAGGYQFPRPPQQLLQVAQQRAEAAADLAAPEVMAKIATGANKITPSSYGGTGASWHQNQPTYQQPQQQYQPTRPTSSSNYRPAPFGSYNNNNSQRFSSNNNNNQIDNSYGLRSMTSSAPTTIASSYSSSGKTFNNHYNPVTTSAHAPSAVTPAPYNSDTPHNNSNYYQQQQQQPPATPYYVQHSRSGWNSNANPATAAPSAYADPYAGYYAAHQHQQQQQQPSAPSTAYQMPYRQHYGAAVPAAAQATTPAPAAPAAAGFDWWSAPPPPPPPTD